MAIQQPIQPSAAPVAVEHVAITEQPRYNFRAAAAVSFVVGVVEILVAGRFLLKLFGASDKSSFVSFIYAVTSPLVAPFHGIFANTATAGNVFEPASLVAMAVVALIGWGAVVLIRITTAPRGTRPATS